jgi:hypothetical protein
MSNQRLLQDQFGEVHPDSFHHMAAHSQETRRVIHFGTLWVSCEGAVIFPACCAISVIHAAAAAAFEFLLVQGRR